MTAGKVVLLIDDDRFFAKLTAAMLAPAEVVIAKNGTEAQLPQFGVCRDVKSADLLGFR